MEDSRSLKGLFAGVKRKKLQQEIDELQEQLKQIVADNDWFDSLEDEEPDHFDPEDKDWDF